MKFWCIFSLFLLHGALQNVMGQQPPKSKRPKEPAENKIKPAIKRFKPKITKLKEGEPTDPASKGQSIMTQVMDKGRFQKPAAMMSLAAGQNLELRCKGNRIDWSYPTFLDTFKDSRLRAKRQNKNKGDLYLGNAAELEVLDYSVPHSPRSLIKPMASELI